MEPWLAWDGKDFTGMPVLIKAGGIVPMRTDYVDNAAQRPLSQLTLSVAAGADVLLHAASPAPASDTTDRQRASARRRFIRMVLQTLGESGEFRFDGADGHVFHHHMRRHDDACAHRVVRRMQQGDGAAIGVADKHRRPDAQLRQQGRQHLQGFMVHVIRQQPALATHILAR